MQHPPQQQQEGEEHLTLLLQNNKIGTIVVATLAITAAIVTIPQFINFNISFGQVTYTNPKLILGTFTARGLIGSLIFNNTGKAITPSNFNPAQNPYILTGNWGLNVVNKKITYFEVNFTMVHADGTDRHTHEFTNFKRISVIPILLDSKGLTLIGMMDIKLNGEYKWFGAPVTITIGKNFNTLYITSSPKYTDNHFMGQSIYGVFTSLRDQYGTQLIINRPSL
jgi:hypothetical protein